jgi:alkaline phosphatase
MGLNYVNLSLLQDQQSPFYEFKTIGLAVTKSADKLITDSAAGATAIATGYHTNNKFISVDPDNKPLYTIFEHASSLGLSTGIVVTSDVVCATPSPFIAHHNSRYDKFILAEQFVESEIDVLIGGGTNYFLPVENGGNRTDKKNLIEKVKSKNFKYYDKVNNLLSSSSGEKIFSLLTKEGLPKSEERTYSLGDLTSVALKNLSGDPDGFILMVEGSQIDWGGHDRDDKYVLNEISDFSTAVKICLDFAKNNSNTLIIITADHETGGLAIEGGDIDGSDIELDFTSEEHTAGTVPVFAFGPGAEIFSGIYDNFMIGRNLFKLLDENYTFTSNK